MLFPLENLSWSIYIFAFFFFWSSSFQFLLYVYLENCLGTMKARFWRLKLFTRDTSALFQQYQNAPKLEQFVTRFLLKETLNQLQSLQNSLECAMETTEEQTRQERWVWASIKKYQVIELTSVYHLGSDPLLPQLICTMCEVCTFAVKNVKTFTEMSVCILSGAL